MILAFGIEYVQVFLKFQIDLTLYRRCQCKRLL